MRGYSGLLWPTLRLDTATIQITQYKELNLKETFLKAVEDKGSSRYGGVVWWCIEELGARVLRLDSVIPLEQKDALDSSRCFGKAHSKGKRRLFGQENARYLHLHLLSG